LKIVKMNLLKVIGRIRGFKIGTKMFLLCDIRSFLEVVIFIVDNHRFLRYNSLCHRQQNDNKKSDSQNQWNNPYIPDTLS